MFLIVDTNVLFSFFHSKFDKAPIWSREPRLKRQKSVDVLWDEEVKEYFGLTEP